MLEERNNFQISRKDAKNCFVESLYDAFEFGKIHLVFATYDLNRPAGQRQTNNIHIYIAADEFLELCRKLNCGELRYMIQSKKKSNDQTPIYECLGGTSAEKLAKQGRSRPDGRSLSRVAKIVVGNRSDILFVAEFGCKPENHVAVSMAFETLSELLLLTQAHYTAWLTAQYMTKPKQNKTNSSQSQFTGNNQEPEVTMF